MALFDTLVTRFAAYPAAWPRHLAWRRQAARWHRRGGLTAPQLAAIEAAYPAEWLRPAWPIRVALFLVTLLGVSLGSAFAGSVVGLANEFQNFPLTLWALLILVGSGVMLEFAIRNNKTYHAGPDTALLYVALGACAVLIGRVVLRGQDLAPNQFSLGRAAFLPSLLIWLAVLVAATVRYAERGAAGAAVVTFLVIVTNVLLLTSWGRLLLPFALMSAGGLLVWLARAPRTTSAGTYYYEGARQTIRLLGLVVVYLAGNYLVVREANAVLSGQNPSGHPPFGALFIGFTAAVPLVYIGLGLRRHDRLLLTLGLLAVGFSAFTLRTYRSVLPPAVAAALVGAALTALAAFGLRYLRPHRHGLTSVADAGEDDADDAANPFARANFEALAAAELTPIPPDAGPATTFGGGQFGGGGASSGY